MKLQQLRYLLAIAENGLNITAASEKLFTSQPGVSKQLKLFEEELGFRLFSRNGKSLEGITYAGKLVLEKAANILQEVENIKQLASDLHNEESGTLSIGTTHTQARYVLPEVLQSYRALYPEIKVELHQGTSEQIAEMMKNGEIDFSITSHTNSSNKQFVSLPCFHWDRAILIKKDHPLANLDDITLADLAKYPLITYVPNAQSNSSLLDAFKEEGLTPNVAITARDSDVIKAYVRKGLGVGIVASMAFNPNEDSDLIAITTYDILPSCTTSVAFREQSYLRRFMFDFIELLSPSLNQNNVENAIDEYRKTGRIKSIREHELPYKLIQRPSVHSIAA